MRYLVHLRAERYVCDVVGRLEVELAGMGAGFPSGRCGLFVMMLRSVIRRQVKWPNFQLVHARAQNEGSGGKLYDFFAVLCMSHLTDLSMSAARSLILELGFNPTTASLCLVTSKPCALYPTLRHREDSDGHFSWESRRDQTSCLTYFVLNTYAIGEQLFYVPICQFLTMDDELMGNRSKHNQVKLLFLRKADREGQMSEVLVHILFRITLDARLLLRGSTQAYCVTALLEIAQDCSTLLFQVTKVRPKLGRTFVT